MKIEYYCKMYNLDKAYLFWILPSVLLIVGGVSFIVKLRFILTYNMIMYLYTFALLLAQ